MAKTKSVEVVDWLLFENEAHNKGYKFVCGIDEAGRGPLAGPVCAAAVILPDNLIIDGVNDSKKLTEKKREELYDVIIEKSVAYSIAFSTVEEIERFNILNATMSAMQHAVQNLDVKADFAMVDGNRLPALDIPSQCIIKGDTRSMSIACASILAKVTRDRLMLEYAQKYPQYFFEKHKGYGTKLHTDMILQYGACEIHRPSFLRKLLKDGK